MALPPSPTVKGEAAVTVMPAVSSSVTVTARLTLATGSYSAALLPSTTAWAMTAASATASSSSAALTVTVWGVSQSLAVKVRVFCTPVVSPSVSAMVTSALLLLISMTTSEEGSLASCTV